MCNVFTLRSSEINAVVVEIDGAKRELSPDKKASSKTRGKSEARDKNENNQGTSSPFKSSLASYLEMVWPASS